MRRLAAALLLLAFAGCGSQHASGARVELTPGGLDAFQAYLREQRGRPVVVNKWASWCAPCRAEFPYLADQARKRRGDVVFVGVNSNDDEGDARDFLAAHPLPYRQFADPHLAIAASLRAVQAFPATAFYDPRGELAFVHQGAYPSERDLARDVDRYAR